MGRPASSAVSKGERAFREISGVKRVEIHVVTATKRHGVQKSWEKLERGLLEAFLEKFDKLAFYNKLCQKYKVDDVGAYFVKSRLEATIADLS